jgi:hypothetical protein
MHVFVDTCLGPLYLEPIEQALSDLLTRSTVARFNVKGFLRADIKTRYEVHKTAIETGIYGPDYAQREEGILPGDVEFAPVPFAPPSAVPTVVPQRGLSMRDVRCPTCSRLVVRAAGNVEGWCRHCKAPVTSSVAEDRPVLEALRDLATATAPAPVTVTIAEGAIAVHNAPVPVTLTAPEPPVVNVEAPVVNLPAPVVTVNLAPLVEEQAQTRREFTQLRKDMRADLRAAMAPRTKHVDRDPKGLIVTIREEIA